MDAMRLLIAMLLVVVGTADAKDDRADVLAVADAALAAINAGDPVAITDLMFEHGITSSVRTLDDKLVIRSQTWAENRENRPDVVIVERGFDPAIIISGPIAVVWYPYDLYLDGEWSHCGVDVFNMLRSNDGWKITSMSWSVEQPPACKAHPDGPP